MDYRHSPFKPDEFRISVPLTEMHHLKDVPCMDLLKYILSKEDMGIIKDARMVVVGAESIHTVTSLALFGISILMWEKVLSPEMRRLYSNIEWDCIRSADGKHVTIYARLK